LSTGHVLAGVLPVIQTPFTDADEIDETALRREIGWAFQHEADGIVTGMVSEVLRLSTDERERLAQVVCEESKSHGGLAVISCGAESSHTALRLAAHAQQLGADAVMAIPPLSVSLGDIALFAYYRAIIETTTMEVVVQDASNYVGHAMSIELQARLLEQYGDRVSFKPEAEPVGPRLSALRDATGGRARIFEGSAGAALVDSHRRGIVGTMPGTEVVWAIRALWDALERGDGARANNICGPLMALAAFQSTVDGYVAVEKHLLYRQGVLPHVRQRGPLGFQLDDETKVAVDLLFDRLQDAVGKDVGIPKGDVAS
jgi:4-hydroxy-tetrahydrodipicolinate synthase